MEEIEIKLEANFYCQFYIEKTAQTIVLSAVEIEECDVNIEGMLNEHTKTEIKQAIIEKLELFR